METPYPSANRYGPANRFYRPYKTSATRHVLHSMADISKQVSEGQKKWRQGVDVTSTSDVNDYIKFKILEYGYFKLKNDDLWEQYQEDFADFTEAIFKTCDRIATYNL